MTYMRRCLGRYPLSAPVGARGARTVEALRGHTGSTQMGTIAVGIVGGAGCATTIHRVIRRSDKTGKTRLGKTSRGQSHSQQTHLASHTVYYRVKYMVATRVVTGWSIWMAWNCLLAAPAPQGCAAARAHPQPRPGTKPMPSIVHHGLGASPGGCRGAPGGCRHCGPRRGDGSQGCQGCGARVLARSRPPCAPVCSLNSNACSGSEGSASRHRSARGATASSATTGKHQVAVELAGGRVSVREQCAPWPPPGAAVRSPARPAATLLPC